MYWFEIALYSALFPFSTGADVIRSDIAACNRTLAGVVTSYRVRTAIAGDASAIPFTRVAAGAATLATAAIAATAAAAASTTTGRRLSFGHPKRKDRNDKKRQDCAKRTGRSFAYSKHTITPQKQNRYRIDLPQNRANSRQIYAKYG